VNEGAGSRLIGQDLTALSERMHSCMILCSISSGSETGIACQGEHHAWHGIIPSAVNGRYAPVDLIRQQDGQSALAYANNAGACELTNAVPLHVRLQRFLLHRHRVSSRVSRDSALLSAEI